ncbi:MAG: hypothetical protein AB1765_09875 [Candidatus Hydrogenedentota bacterium]
MKRYVFIIIFILVFLSSYTTIFLKIASKQNKFMFDTGENKHYMTYDTEEYFHKADYVQRFIEKYKAGIKKIAVYFTLPANPWGDKPFFVFAAGLMRIICKNIIATDWNAIYYLNIISLFCSIIMNFIIIYRVYGVLSAIISFIFLIFTFDLFYLSLAGYHSIFGLHFVLLGILLYSIPQLKDKKLWILIRGILYSISIFSSPHCLAIVIAIFILEIIKSYNRKYLIFGLSVPFIYFILSDILRSIFEIPYISVFKSLLFQLHSAMYYGSILPRQPLFFFKYLIDSEGIDYLFLILLIIIIFLFNFRKKTDTLFLYFLPALFLPLFWFVVKAPMVSRIFTPAIFIMSSIAGAELVALFTGYKNSKKVLMFLSLVIWVCIYFRIYNFIYKINMFEKRWTSDIPSLVNTKGIIKNTDIEYNEFIKIIDSSDGTFLVQLAPKFRHHNFVDIEIEMLISKLMDLGLKPIAESTYHFIPNDCYHNEYFAYWLYFNNNKEILGFYPFLKHLSIHRTYYFSFSDIKKYYSEVSEKPCF